MTSGSSDPTPARRAADPTAAPPGGAGAPPGRSLAHAVATAVALLAILAVCYVLGTGAFFVLVSVAASLALFEVLDALAQAGRRPVTPFALACGLAMTVVAYARRPALLAVVLGVATIGSWVLALRPRRGSTAGSDAAWSVMAVAWIGGGAAAVVTITMLPGAGLSLVLAFLLTVAAADIAAYVVGSRWGRRKLAPRLSPGKSWEGAAGGLMAALAAGALLGLAIDDLGPLDGLALGGICGMLAPLGDLVESLFKRELGIKDSGRLLPGHGGFLDRLDAAIFCAPVALLYLQWAQTSAEIT